MDRKTMYTEAMNSIIASTKDCRLVRVDNRLPAIAMVCDPKDIIKDEPKGYYISNGMLVNT